MKNILQLCKNYLHAVDKFFLSLIIFTAGCGVFLVFECTTYFFGTKKYLVIQLGAMLLGLACAIALSNIDYRIIAKASKYYIPFMLLLMVLTFFFGLSPEGADDRAWLEIPFVGMTFQPAELLKLGFIVTFSLHLEKVKPNIKNLFNVILLCVHAGLATGLVVLQGDDGTALVYFCIFVIMMFAAGVPLRYFLTLFAIIGIAAPVLWLFIMNYDQKQRILDVIYPDIDPQGISFQPKQGEIALGSGQLFGKGFGGTLRKVPAIQSDYIFAYIGQVLGFVGCVAVMFLIALLCVKILGISMKSRDMLGKMICVGIFAMISSQAVINIAMVLRLAPVIGITLPLFSYGGSSMLITFLGLGLVLSVQCNNRIATLYEK